MLDPRSGFGPDQPEKLRTAGERGTVIPVGSMEGDAGKGVAAAPHATVMRELIQIIDPDPALAHALEPPLRAEQRRLSRARTAVEGLAAIERERPDLVLIDLEVPDRPGIEVVRRLRLDPRTRTIPIMACSERGGWDDQLDAFVAGVDSYLTKPVVLRKLLVRLDGLLRGAYEGGSRRGIVETGALRLEPSTLRAWNGAAQLDLTTVEFRILSILVACAGQVVSSPLLLDEVRGVDPRATLRSVEQAVVSLRRKLGAASRCLEATSDGGHRFSPREVP